MDDIKKICLITGASRGIGKGIVTALQKLDYPVYVVATATSAPGLQSIQDTLNDSHLEGEARQLDLLDSDSIANLLEYLDRKKLALDILINNAGITRDNLLLRMQESQWHEVMQANLHASFKLCRYAVKKMMKKRWGRIVNISSVVGITGNPGQANYAAAKAGMIAFTKSLATEFATRNITANCICPGFIETDMTKVLDDKQKQAILQNVPMQRMGTVEDIAHTVNFLLHEHASYMTGATLHVNGGLVML
ncbi:MAG: 3-oxoacyl-[acyl-carrier-protein] reductase [Pseudomonadota bacterium]|nr:3-oxoacyl-[acyl-carrier-protein] reductase [Pseudomonadota bacterium]